MNKRKGDTRVGQELPCLDEKRGERATEAPRE